MHAEYIAACHAKWMKLDGVQCIVFQVQHFIMLLPHA